MAFVAALSIWYLARPLLVQGKVDATRFDITARVDGRVAEIPVIRGQDVAAGAASCLIRRAWSPVSLAAIWRDLPGFTGDGATCGSNRANEGKLREGNCDTEGRTMTTLEATKSKNSSGVTRSGRLFVLELSGDRITR